MHNLKQYITSVRNKVSDCGTFPEVVDFLQNAPGKNIRSTLFYLLTKAINKDTEVSVDLGAALELLHTASLFHDDVIDEAKTRRNKMSLNYRYSSKFSILAGDMLITQAINLVKQYGAWEVLDIFCKLSRDLISGVLLEKDITLKSSLEDYYKLIDLKTGSFFVAISKLIVFILHLHTCDETQLLKFGVLFGRLFQILDDYRDYFCAKDIGRDFSNCVITLPILSIQGSDNLCVKKLFEQGSPGDFMKILKIMEAHSVKQKIKNILQEINTDIESCCRFFQPSEYKTYLTKLINDQMSCIISA